MTKTDLPNNEKEKAMEENNDQVENEIKQIEENEVNLQEKLQEVQKLSEELDKREVELNQKEEEVNKLKNETEDKGKKIEEQKQTLEKQRLHLERLQIELSEREQNAETGFFVQRRQVIDKVTKSQEAAFQLFEKAQNDLIRQLAQKRKEVDVQIFAIEQEAITVQKVQNEKIRKLREEKMAALEEEYKREEQAMHEQLKTMKKEMETRNAQLQKDAEEKRNAAEQLRKHYEDAKLDLERQQKDLEGKQQQLEEDLKQLAIDKQYYKERRQHQDEIIEKLVEERYDYLLEEIDIYNKSISKYKKKISELSDYKNEKELLEAQVGSRTETQLLEDIEKYRKEIKKMEHQISLVPEERELEKLKENGRKYEELRQQKEDRDNLVADLTEKLGDQKVLAAKLEAKQVELEVTARHLESLSTRINLYETEVNRLKELHKRPQEIAERKKTIENMDLVKVWQDFSVEEVEEMEWLEDIHKKSAKSGIDFSKRLLYSFHTALKTSEFSPITVLAGVSGTGKSELPKLYARFGGIYFQNLSVQSDWDSPQSLFGYFNSIDNKFNPTTLLQWMVQFQESSVEEGFALTTFKDAVLLVLLDEMNLAHVELYFSDLLSKLETRRGSKEPVYFEIDLGGHKYKVNLSRNVLWVGTMNNDETTKTLSDKVIDRGNIINFPRPKNFISRAKPEIAEASPMLQRKRWDQWINQMYRLTSEQSTNYRKVLEEINDVLGVSGRALGHRVWQSIENYMANHPLVILASQSNEEEEVNASLQFAFEEALVYKLMPKLSGLELDVGEIRTECIDKIAKIIDEKATGIFQDFDNATKNAYQIFLWRSAEYLNNQEYDEFLQKYLS